ncbi:MAG: phage tail tape measure protein, partial [Ruminococcus sp.]|nr:phage tail tape measure protein [Ruminococcus sp.]
DYRGVMDKLYSNNYGEDKNDIAQSIAEVKQQLGDISPDELEKVTENALLLRDTFEFDVNESIRAAKMLMSQFEVSADEAYTLIAQGAQNGLNKNGDLLDTINEYAVHYNQLGYSAEEFFNSLSNGTAAGTFSVDKLGDAMKEFGIRTKDTADSTTEGFDLIGLDADEMRQKFAEGGEAAKQAAQETIDALFALDDKIVQNQAGVDLFGTMWEDLGSEGIAALSNISGTADKTAGVLQDIADIKYNDAANQAELLKRKLKTEFLEPVANKVMPLLIDKTDWVVDNLPKMIGALDKAKPVAVGVGAAFAAWKVADVVKNAATAISGFGAALAANPVGAAVVGVAALTAGITALVSAHEEEETVLDRSIEKYKDQIDAVEEADEKINDLKRGFEEDASAVDDEYDRLQDLKEELDHLADSSGNVKEKDKARAEYILGELSDALGTEYEMTGNQIENYRTLSAEIDNLIAKKRYESAMSAYYANSEEMSKQKAEQKENYVTFDAAFQEDDAEYQKAIAAFEALKTSDAQWDTNVSWEDVKKSVGVAGGTVWYPQEVFDAVDAIYQAKSERALSLSKRNEAEKSLNSVIEWEQRGYEAERLAAEGDYSGAVDAVYQNKDASRKVLDDINATEEERLKAFKDCQTKITSELEFALKTRETMGIESAQREADAAFKSMEESVTAGLAAGVDATEIMTDDMRAMIKKMLDSGFDINGLARWMSRTGIELSDVFEDDYHAVVQKQFDQGYEVDGLLAWGQATDASLFKEFDEEFLMKVQDSLDAGFDNANLVMWAEESGKSMGEIMGMSLSERLSEYTNWLYENNPILSQTTTRWGNSDRIEMVNGKGQGGLYVRPEDVDRYIGMGYQPRYATGGYIPSGSSGIVAEAGPELLQVMNGGVRVIPLTKEARNTEASAVGGSQKIFYNTYNINNPKISNGMDVRRLAESLANEQRRIETGRGE